MNHAIVVVLTVLFFAHSTFAQQMNPVPDPTRPRLSAQIVAAVRKLPPGPRPKASTLATAQPEAPSGQQQRSFWQRRWPYLIIGVAAGIGIGAVAFKDGAEGSDNGDDGDGGSVGADGGGGGTGTDRR